jgi:hypothetical protein
MTVKVSKPAINVREELADLRKPSGVAGEAMLRAETPQEQFDLIGAGRRNLIINGDFQVSQRGDYSSATAITNGGYYLDRFKMAISLATSTIQHYEVVLPNGTKTMAMKVAATSDSSGYVGFRHVIEDFRVLSGQTVTASMWVRTTLKNVTFRHDSTTNFGEAVVPDGEWRYHTATYQMPTIVAAGGGGNQTTLAIINYIEGVGGAGTTTGQYFEVAQFQLELGKVATPFEHRFYGEELAACQRYYEVAAQGSHIGGFTYYTTTNAYGAWRFRVEKRAAPTVSASGSTAVSVLSNGNAYQSTAIAFANVEPASVRVSVITSARTNGHGAWVNLNNGYFIADAEL